MSEQARGKLGVEDLCRVETELTKRRQVLAGGVQDPLLLADGVVSELRDDEAPEEFLPRRDK